MSKQLRPHDIGIKSHQESCFEMKPNARRSTAKAFAPVQDIPAAAATGEHHGERRPPTAPGEMTVWDFMDHMDDIASRWSGILERLQDGHSYGKNAEPPLAPLPDWAAEVAGNWKSLHAAWDEQRNIRTMLRETVRLMEGRAAKHAYEIWSTARGGRRLSIRLESREEAESALAYWKVRPGYTDAAVVSMHIDSRLAHANSDPALLETFIGQVWHSATTFAHRDEQEDTIEVQDETGRAVSVSASMLRAHPVFERLHDKAKAHIEHSIQRSTERARRRATGQPEETQSPRFVNQPNRDEV